MKKLLIGLTVGLSALALAACSETKAPENGTAVDSPTRTGPLQSDGGNN